MQIVLYLGEVLISSMKKNHFTDKKCQKNSVLLHETGVYRTPTIHKAI